MKIEKHIYTNLDTFCKKKLFKEIAYNRNICYIMSKHLQRNTNELNKPRRNSTQKKNITERKQRNSKKDWWGS